MKHKNILTILIILASLILIWVYRDSLTSTMMWFSSMDAVTHSMQQAGIWGPSILFILFVLQVFLAFIPGQALMVACGYLYGFWGGFLLSWLSLVVGGEIAYVLARKYGRPFAERWIAPEVLDRWDKAAIGQGVGFFAIMLTMPLIPNDAMCYVAGLGSISHRRFIAANMLGRGMACVLTSATGALGGSLTWQGWALIITVFVLVGIAYYAITFRKSNLVIA